MAALRRRRFLILFAVLGCTLLTAFGATRMKREYLATATLMPQEQALGTISELARSPEAEQERDELDGRQDRLKTVATILNSPEVLGTVIQKMGLKTTPALLQENIEVKEVTSQVLRVAVKDTDPQKAGGTVNSIVDTFVTFFSDLRSREARKQLKLAEAEKAAADAELAEAGGALARFKKSSDISSLEEQTRVALESSRQVGETRNAAEASLRDVSAQVAHVQQLLARTPAKREIRESATQDKLVDKLQLDVAALRSALDKELTARTDEHPNVVRLKQQLTEAEQRLTRASSQMATTIRVVDNPERDRLELQLRELQNQRDGLMARVATLNAETSRLQSKVSRYSGADVQISLLTQRYTLAQQRQNAANNRLSQIRSVTAMLAGGSPIAVVDRAGPQNPPFDLSQGRTLRLTVLAFVMSLAVCIALAVGLEMADRRVRTVADAETLMHLPVVSVVPQLGGRTNAGKLCLTTENDPSSHLSEAYHFLANHILRQTGRRESTVLMGATARPGQGATTALTNLAIALARAGRHVVLIEADLRRPFLHEVFDTDHKPGLTDALKGSVPVSEALSGTHIENLRLLPAGSTTADPWSLLWKPELARIVQELRESADYVIFNVPSATVFADAMCVAPHVDGAVLVMRSSEMPSGAEQKVRDWLEDAEVPVMGMVLNGVPSREMETTDFHRSYTARPANVVAPALTAPAAAPVRRVA
ncbi:MAG: GumC family protein [Actinomycetota bacterium]